MGPREGEGCGWSPSSPSSVGIAMGGGWWRKIYRRRCKDASRRRSTSWVYKRRKYHVERCAAAEVWVTGNSPCIDVSGGEEWEEKEGGGVGVGKGITPTIP